MTCTHHYKVDTIPTDGLTHGICKLCGKERDFPSAIEYKFTSLAHRPRMVKWEEDLMAILGKETGWQ